MNHLYYARLQQANGAARDAEGDSDVESSYDYVEEIDDSSSNDGYDDIYRFQDLPTHFLGVAIQRKTKAKEESGGDSEALESSDVEDVADLVLEDDTDPDEDGSNQTFSLPTQFFGLDTRSQISPGQHQQPHLRINIDTASTVEISTNKADFSPHVPGNCNDDDTTKNGSGSIVAGPPSPWRYSKTKQRITDDLKDGSSDIHLHIGVYRPNQWKDVRFQPLWEKYAKRYSLSNFTANLKRILLHYQAGTGDFKDKATKAEPWYTSTHNVSAAYSLLFLLYMEAGYSKKIKNMPVEEVWGSHPLFQCYELEKFKSYNKKMIALTNKRKGMIDKEEEMYRRDMLALPECALTSRNVPFWNKHSASDLLESDEKSGIAKHMKPKILWESRKEYKDFPLPIFHKHIYQERTKQLAAPFWQHKRNQKAQKKSIEEAKKMKEGWHQNQFENGMKEVLGQWDKLNLDCTTD